jgi:hypothetical protein
MKKVLGIIIKMGRAVFGGIGIILVVVGLVSLALGILTILEETDNRNLLKIGYQQAATGTVMLLVGLPLFGVCVGALKRPLYLLAPIVLIASYLLAGILLPESMQGVKGQGAGLGALVISILAFRFINRYYSKREQDVKKMEEVF